MGNRQKSLLNAIPSSTGDETAGAGNSFLRVESRKGWRPRRREEGAWSAERNKGERSIRSYYY
jgi:hypothetical protein